MRYNDNRTLNSKKPETMMQEQQDRLENLQAKVAMAVEHL